MKKLMLSVVLCVSAAGVWAHGCPGEMKVVDAKLATSPKMSDADMAKVKQLRADGEKLHKEGKHTESMKALADAKKLLGV